MHQVTIINLLSLPFLIRTISLVKTIFHQLYIKSLAEIDLVITTLVGKHSIITLTCKDLDITIFANKDLSIINHHISHHDVHNECTQHTKKKIFIKFRSIFMFSSISSINNKGHNKTSSCLIHSIFHFNPFLFI